MASIDPVTLWKGMFGEMEKGFNSFANQAIETPSKAINQVNGIAVGAQKQFGDIMERYLASMNMPSRAQMAGMAERLQSIEGLLNELKAVLSELQQSPAAPPDPLPVTATPPRAKRPPGGQK